LGAVAKTQYDQPAAHLVGLELADGWRVAKRIERSCNQTGGAFSIGYIAERSVGRDVQTGFVKALDFSRVHELPMAFTHGLQSLLESFNFERDLVKHCAGRRMRNVVRAMADGEVQVGVGQLSWVSYLIFEVAVRDIRVALDSLQLFDAAWAFRVLHDVANGLRQLHDAGVYHQDLKPSNVLDYAADFKLTDLGRARRPGFPAPHDSEVVGGDPGYAAPEGLYNQPNQDPALHSMAADVYHLGSMVAFMFAKVGMTTAIRSHLPEPCWPERWRSDFQSVIPHWRAAFDDAVDKLRVDVVPGQLQDDVEALVRELCEPDPVLRGSPRGGDDLRRRYSMERYVTRLDVLRRQAEIRLRVSLK
jgi:eukaryotic-like serine/threonine-protein kinase